MNKGFTLMEMLAVVLVVALLMSLALPVYRSVRFEMRRNQAEEAAIKMAEAMRTYYTRTKGGIINNSFSPLSNPEVLNSTACTNVLATGIPHRSVEGSLTISQLFACGYLSPKDFQNLPFQFTANGRGDAYGCLVTVTGLERAGQYSGKNFYVSRKMVIAEKQSDCE